MICDYIWLYMVIYIYMCVCEAPYMVYLLKKKKTYVLFPSELSSFPSYRANHPLRYVASPTLLDLLFLCESACEHLWHRTRTGFHGRALDGMIFASLTWRFHGMLMDSYGCWWILMDFDGIVLGINGIQASRIGTSVSTSLFWLPEIHRNGDA